MAIKVACACGKKLAVKDELAGKKVKCPACQKLLSIPKPKAQAESLDDEWDLGDSAEEDFGDEPSDAPVKSRGGKSSPSRGTVSRTSSVKGKGKKSKSSNRGLLIGLSAGGGVLVVALLVWMLWPAAPAANVAGNPPANQEQTAAPVSGDTAKPTKSAPQVVDAVQQTLTLNGHTNAISDIAFSPDGNRLASASFDNTVKLWDAANGQELLTLKGHTDQARSVAFSTDGKRLVSASIDKTVKIWDATSGQELLTFKGHTKSVGSVAFSADGKWLASASWDQTVKVWDAMSGQETLTMNPQSGGLNSVAWSADGKRLASAGERGIKLWDATSGQELLTLKGHTGEVSRVVFSADGKWLVSASFDKTVKVWDAVSGQQSLTLKGHGGPVVNVALSADGKWLASASWDGTVKVWDAASGQETLTSKEHTSQVYSVAFSPDGKRLSSGSLDKTVKVWDFSNHANSTGTAPSVPENALANDAGSDLKALQGDWHVVEFQTDPPTPAIQVEESKKMVVTIAGDVMTYWGSDLKIANTIKLDSTQNPKAIDLISKAGGPGAGGPQLGIYSLEGETLKMVMGQKTRPTSLNLEPGSKQAIMVYHRGRPAGLENAQLPEDKFDHKAWERAQPTLAQMRLHHQLIPRLQSPDMIPEGVLTVAMIDLPSLRTGDIYPENLFSTLKSLSHVILIAQEMGDARLKQLSELPGLIGLSLVGNGKFTITANGLAHLKRSPQLRYLRVDAVSLTPDLINVIGEFSNLRSLAINSIPVTDDLLSIILQLKELESLNLGATQLTDSGVAQLAKLSSLKMLDLSDTKVTDQGLPSLKSLSKLQFLGLRKLNVSPQAVDELQKALPGCKILK